MQSNLVWKSKRDPGQGMINVYKWFANAKMDVA